MLLLLKQSKNQKKNYKIGHIKTNLKKDTLLPIKPRATSTVALLLILLQILLMAAREVRVVRIIQILPTTLLVQMPMNIILNQATMIKEHSTIKALKTPAKRFLQEMKNLLHLPVALLNQILHSLIRQNLLTTTLLLSILTRSILN